VAAAAFPVAAAVAAAAEAGNLFIGNFYGRCCRRAFMPAANMVDPNLSRVLLPPSDTAHHDKIQINVRLAPKILGL
jgi:hypothetical protein